MRTFVLFRPICAVTSVSVVIFLAGCIQDSAVRELEEQNKALVQQIHAEVSKGNLEIFDEVLSPDYVRHCQAMPPELQEIHGTEVFKAFVADFVNSVSNCRSLAFEESHLLSCRCLMTKQWMIERDSCCQPDCVLQSE